MERAKEFYLGRRAMDMQGDSTLAAHYGIEAVYGIKHLSEEEIVKRIRAISAKEVQEVCRKIFRRASHGDERGRVNDSRLSALTFVAIFVALDIIGTLPMYVAMTDGMTDLERKRVVQSLDDSVALIVALIFMFIGEEIFGISGSRFTISGSRGVSSCLLISLADLVGNAEVKSRASGHTGIVPLAVPLITGPAVLTTLILQASHVGYLITIGALFANYLLGLAGCLYHSAGVTRVIGKDGTVVISKIAALLLAAIAISMIRSGIFESIQKFR